MALFITIEASQPLNNKTYNTECFTLSSPQIKLSFGMKTVQTQSCTITSNKHVIQRSSLHSPHFIGPAKTKMPCIFDIILILIIILLIPNDQKPPSLPLSNDHVVYSTLLS